MPAIVKHQVTTSYFYYLHEQSNLITEPFPFTLAETFLSKGLNLVKLPFIKAFTKEIFF